MNHEENCYMMFYFWCNGYFIVAVLCIRVFAIYQNLNYIHNHSVMNCYSVHSAYTTRLEPVLNKNTSNTRSTSTRALLPTVLLFIFASILPHP